MTLGAATGVVPGVMGAMCVWSECGGESVITSED